MAGHGQERNNRMAESTIAGSSGHVPLLGLSLILRSSQLDGEEEEYSTVRSDLACVQHLSDPLPFP